jgi:hypothetical protein
MEHFSYGNRDLSFRDKEIWNFLMARRGITPLT